MPNSSKVIFCTDGIFPHAVGGMQRHSRLLIEALANQGVEIVVIHPHDEQVFEKKSGVKELSIKGIDDKKNYLRECYRYSKRVHKIVQQYPGHVIYSQGLSIWYRAGDFSDRLIVNPHGLEPFQSFGLKNVMVAQPFIRVFKRIFKKAKYVVSLGGRLTDILNQSLPTDKIVVLPNAVEGSPEQVQRNFPDKAQPLKLFFIARFAHNKGIHILLQAIQELNEAGYEEQLQYTLAGKGPLHAEITKKFDYKNIHYPGFVSDDQLKQFYHEHDIFVFPTLFEGMPTVVLEAMQYGLPIIVSDTGATAELVDETNGFLIPKNDVEAVKESILNFYQMDADQKAKLSEASGIKVRQNFTWEKVAEAHREVFSRIESAL